MQQGEERQTDKKAQARLKKVVVGVLTVVVVATVALTMLWATGHNFANPVSRAPTAEELDIRGTEEGRLVEEYLRLKYGEEFVLGETYIYEDSGLDYDEMFTNIYVRTNPGFVSGINTTFTPDLNNPEDKAEYYDGTFYLDSYIEDLWDYQYNADIAPLMQELFGEDVLFEADLYWLPDEYPMYPWYGRTVSYDEAWELGEQQYLKFYAMVFSEDGKMNENKTQQIFNYFRPHADGFSNTSITIGFYKKSEKNVVLEELGHYLNNLMDYVDDDVSIKTGFMMPSGRVVYQQVAVTSYNKEQLFGKLQDIPVVR